MAAETVCRHHTGAKLKRRIARAHDVQKAAIDRRTRMAAHGGAQAFDFRLRKSELADRASNIPGNILVTHQVMRAAMIERICLDQASACDEPFAHVHPVVGVDTPHSGLKGLSLGKTILKRHGGALPECRACIVESHPTKFVDGSAAQVVAR